MLEVIMAHHTPDQNLATSVVKGLVRWVAPTLWLAVSAVAVAVAQPRSNMFNDPFVQVTSELPLCPIPEPPGVTGQEYRDLAHDRAQRGVSCWLAGRCRLENAYLYDAEIIPRVQIAIRAGAQFERTSIWAAGQRRWVTLQGCVSTAEQSANAEQLVRRLDDVEGVINQLMVGTDGRPGYRIMPH
jgi:hypothetical protein